MHDNVSKIWCVFLFLSSPQCFGLQGWIRGIQTGFNSDINLIPMTTSFSFPKMQFPKSPILSLILADFTISKAKNFKQFKQKENGNGKYGRRRILIEQQNHKGDSQLRGPQVS